MSPITEPIKILAHKSFPNGGTMTKVRVGADIAYVRENVHKSDDLVDHVHVTRTTQVLELAAAPGSWSSIAQVIALEDSLKRTVVNNADFTPYWAEAALMDTPLHGESCKRNYAVLCLSCERRIDVGEAGVALDQAVAADNLRHWLLRLKREVTEAAVQLNDANYCQNLLGDINQALRGDPCL